MRYVDNYVANIDDAYNLGKDIENKRLLIQQSKSYIDTQEEEIALLLQDLHGLNYDHTKCAGLLQDNLAQQKLVNVEDLRRRLAENKAEHAQRKEKQKELSRQNIQLNKEESSKTMQVESGAKQQQRLVFQEKHWRALLQTKSAVTREDLLTFAKKEKRPLDSKRVKDLESRVISQFNHDG